MSRAILVGPAMLILALAACGGEESTAPEPETAPAQAPRAAEPEAGGAEAGGAEAEQAALQIFQTRCFTCHGAEGGGDGPGSAGLTPAPRNLQDPEWQASVTDEYLEKIIVYGGAAVGKSPMMPGNPDLANRPAVVDALVQHIRSLSRP